MKTSLLSLVILFTISSQNLQASHVGFSGLAFQTVNQTWTQLFTVGLLKLSPWDPRLPRPRVPALSAIASPRVGLLAYYDEEIFPFATNLVFKNPNGGGRHSVLFNRESIQFKTPYAGVIAHANRFMTVNGEGYNFYCRSVLVNFPQFQYCIQRHFIDVIVNQLKQFSN